MGGFVSTVLQWWFPSNQFKIVMVGLDNAGKTTTLYRLHLGQHITTTPTIGSNVEIVQYKNLELEMWDLGGQSNLRPSWVSYFRDADGVVLVVDSTDRARVAIVKAELFNLLDTASTQTAPVLVFANKQDVSGAMDAAQLTDALQLHSIRNHDWQVQACSAVRGTGLMEGLAWLAQRVRQRRMTWGGASGAGGSGSGVGVAGPGGGGGAVQVVGGQQGETKEGKTGDTVG